MSHALQFPEMDCDYISSLCMTDQITTTALWEELKNHMSESPELLKKF